MMRYILFILVFKASVVSSQNYFYKIVPILEEATNYQILESKGRYFITLTSCFNQGGYCGYVCEVDLTGSIIWKTNIPLTDFAHASSCISNDTIYLAGNGSPNNNKSIIHKISLDGRLISTHHIIDDKNLFSHFNMANLTRFKNKFILTGQAFINDESKGVIISIDDSMILDKIIIDTTLEFSSIWDNHVGPDSLLTCFFKINKKQWPDQVRRIVKYDNDFNQVWSYTSDTLGTNRSFPNGTVLRDGRIVFVDFNPGWPTGINALRCLDTITKKNDWMYIYPFIQSWERRLRSVKQLKNGNIICTGEYTTKTSVPRIEGSPYMMRIDSTGKLLWERAYVEIAPNGKDKRGNLWDVAELENGDLMAVGFVTNNNKWDPLIIRTDHRGCMDGGTTDCPTVKIIDLMTGSEDIIVSTQNKIFIYPNPTNQQNFTVDIPDLDNSHTYLCSVYDLYGKQIFKMKLSQSKQTIDIPNVASGMYIVKILKDNRLIHSEKLIVE